VTSRRKTDAGTDPEAVRDGGATRSRDAPAAPQHAWGGGAGLPATSQPKQQGKVLNLASLSSLELITLIDVFVWGWIYFVVLFILQLFYFLELEQRGCCQPVVRVGAFQGRSQTYRHQPPPPARQRWEEQSLLYQRHHVIMTFHHATSSAKHLKPVLKRLAAS